MSVDSEQDRLRMEGRIAIGSTGISDGARWPASMLDLPSRATYAAYAAGTAYTLTATPAALDFGTTDPVISLGQAGTYLILASVTEDAAGAVANYVSTYKLRRTNNTAADVTGSTITRENATPAEFGDNSTTTITLPAVIYTTANANDAITIFGSLTETTPTVIAASIVAVRLY